jgi:hypothetical protein
MLAEFFGASLGVIAGFSLLYWVFLAVAFGFIILSINLFDSKYYGFSGTSMVPPLVIIGWFNRDYIGSVLAAHGPVIGVIQLILMYAAAGIVVAFVNWVFYCWHVKDRYQEAVTDEARTRYDDIAEYIIAKLGVFTDEVTLSNIDTSDPMKYGLTKMHIQKWLQIKITQSNATTIFGDRNHASYVLSMVKSDVDNLITNSITDEDRGLARMDTILHKMYPPKALACKRLLIASALEWPITVLWLILARVIRTICDRAFWISRRFLDFVSRISFGSHDVKL